MHHDIESQEDKLYGELYKLAEMLLTNGNLKVLQLPLVANVDWQKGPSLTKDKTYMLEASMSIEYAMGRPMVNVDMVFDDDTGATTRLSGAHLLMFNPVDREAAIETVNSTLHARRTSRLTEALKSLTKAADHNPMTLKPGDVVSRQEKLDIEVVDDEYTWVVAYVLNKAEQLLYWKAHGGQTTLQHVILIGTQTGNDGAHMRTCIPASALDLVKIGTLADFGLELPEGDWLEMILPMGPGFSDLVK